MATAEAQGVSRMAMFHPRFDRPGTAPGTIREHESPRVPSVLIRRCRYSVERCEDDEPATGDAALENRPQGGVTWIDVVGLSDATNLRHLGERLGLHALALEDVFNTWQRPKLESFDDHLFVVMRLLRFGSTLESEQISMFIGRDWVVTIQETDRAELEPVRERIRSGKGRIRRLGADYLAYAILDALIDNYFPLLERYGDRLESLETMLVERPEPAVLSQLHELKKDLLQLRRAAWPQREVVNALARSEEALIGPETRIFLRDGYDHAVQILDIVETYRDIANGLTDLYLTSVSNRTNEVMRVLTVMASIFIPLTFIAGVYGMNFDPTAGPLNMPELGWNWGYPSALAAMAAVAAGLLFFFKRKGWI
jgi:magnesium transporter